MSRASGPSRSAEDCALLLNALAAPDARDPTTFGQPLEDFTAATRPGSIEGMRIALPDTKQLPGFMHADVTKAWQAAGRWNELVLDLWPRFVRGVTTDDELSLLAQILRSGRLWLRRHANQWSRLDLSGHALGMVESRLYTPRERTES